jgi:hypothetical protein
VKLSQSSTHQELREPGCYKAGGCELRGHQLGRRQTLDLRQPGARYVLSSTVPRYGYSSRLMNSCTILDPLGTQAIRRPGHLSGRGGEDVLGMSTSYIFKFYLFLALLHNFTSLLHAGPFSFGGRH